MRRYVPVDINNMPDVFEVEVGGDSYQWRVDYNAVADYYTATVDKDNQRLITGEPLLLENLVGQDIPNPDLPVADIRVMDESGQARDNGLFDFGFNVWPYLDEIDPNGSETTDPNATPLGYDPDEEDEQDGEIIIL